MFIFFFQAEDGIRDIGVTGVQTCALPICHYICEIDAIVVVIVVIDGIVVVVVVVKASTDIGKA